MAFYTKELYKNIIQEPAKYFNSLKVISGFASSKFLKRVIKDFPDHRFTLIIGMASHGISIKDHQEFKTICTKFKNVKVYYYIETPANHMKVYQWYIGEATGISFIGSANFSEAGFFKQDEILSPTIDIFSNLIDEALNKSISCLDEEVEDKVPLYEEIDYEMIESEQHKDTNPHCNKDYTNQIEKNKKKSNTSGISLKKLLLNNLYLTAYNRVTVELILDDDPHWDTKALNNWNRKNKTIEDSYIDVERTNQLGQQKLDFFPRETDVRLISDDKTEWTVKRVGQYGKELIVTDGVNFYEYFKNRLGISEDRTISYNDFYSYGRTNINLYKLNDNEYLLDFSLS